MRARRGDPEHRAPLEEAWQLAQAEATRSLYPIAPVAAARAEVAWLAGDLDGVAHATELALELAQREDARWFIGTLACWRWRAGLEQEAPPGAAEPCALEIRGNWARAAELWAQIGCPYEAALALAGAEDAETLRRATDELERLGATAAAAVVARRLRDPAARGLPWPGVPRRGRALPG